LDIAGGIVRIQRIATHRVIAIAIAVVAATATGAQDQPKHSYDLAKLDKSCKPCDDFNQFASGGWLKSHSIPPEYPFWGSFITVIDENQKKLKSLLEAAAQNNSAAPGSNDQKIGDFYASCVDTSAINAQGLKPLQPLLQEIAAITSKSEFPAVAAHLAGLRARVFFAFSSDQDLKDSSKVIGEANQGGLGLPDRDYYIRNDAESQALRDKYSAHVAKTFVLLGDSPERAAAEAKTVLAIESALAAASLTNVELRNPDALYHIHSLSALAELTPHFSWPAYFQAIHHPELREINVAQPSFFKGLDAQIAAHSVDDWKSYLRWHFASRTAPYLSDPLVAEDFDFNDRILSGTKENSPRWKICSRSADRFLGEALGQVYVQKYFPPEAKTRMQQMVRELMDALRRDIPTLGWMGLETKKAAIAKLDAFGVKIAYPDKWRDYSALTIDRSSYALNVMRATEFLTRFDLSKIGKPVDRFEWGVSPVTVDAFNNGQMNEIVFPAGILQPPFFDPLRDDAYNYGAIGAVIGHEITHGFDDEGARFDPQGNLRNWWAPDDLKNFQARGECVSNQFSGYVVEGDLHENGKLVEGESIADLGGLAIAFAAYQHHIQGQPPTADASGFTPEQRFFLGYAEVWAVNVRPETAKLMANTNPHALPRFRTNGPLSNMAEFAKAFGCKKGDPMVRETVCKIW
jgi:putative endopeptidase